MYRAGGHREAMFWISCLDTAYLALQIDEPDAEKPVFAAQFQAMHTARENNSGEMWAERVKTVTWLASEIYRIADILVALHRE